MTDLKTPAAGRASLLGKIGKISLSPENKDKLFAIIELFDDDVKEAVKDALPLASGVGSIVGSEASPYFGQQGAARFIAILNLIKLHSFRPGSRTVLKIPEIEFLTIYVPERLIYTSAYMSSRRAGSPHVIKKLMEIAEKFIEFRETVLIPMLKRGEFFEDDHDLI